MKKQIQCFAAALLMVSLAGCSVDVPQKEYDALQAANEVFEQSYLDLQAEYDKFKADAAEFLALQDDEKAARAAQASKERLEAEEEARKAQEEADRLAAERAAEEERKRQEEEEQRLAEEAKGYETGITYEDLARSPEDYKGQKVMFSGRVVQIVEGLFGGNAFRMSTDGSYDDIIYGTYSSNILEVRLLEDDEVTIYGVANGIKKYQSVLGSSVTLPEIIVDRIEFND